jgi:hypothetical protein
LEWVDHFYIGIFDGFPRIEWGGGSQKSSKILLHNLRTAPPNIINYITEDSHKLPRTPGEKPAKNPPSKTRNSPKKIHSIPLPCEKHHAIIRMLLKIAVFPRIFTFGKSKVEKS